MYMAYNFSVFKDESKKILDWLQKELASIHTGKASPIVLDNISIDSYGSYMPIKNIATVSIEDPKTLRIAPWDKQMIKEIEKAITQSNLGLSVVSDSDGVRVIFPMLTTENREKLVKVLKTKLEDARINVRKAREEVQNDIEMKAKEGGFSEDDKFRAKEELQKNVDTVNADLESVFAKKEKEILG